MIAFALFSTPGSGFTTAGNGDQAYTSLVAQILPHGIRGIVACGMLTALMASLASKYNASATLVTMDFFQKWRPNASGRTQVFVGRVSTAVIVLVGILWVLVMKSLGKNLYEYLQSVQGYMSPAIAVLFVMGIFWKRATAPAAFWAFLVGAVGGFLRLGLDLLIERPLKDGLATADMLRAQYGVLFSLQQIHWLYYAEALLVLCVVLVFAISAFTKAPEPSTVRYTYYGATAEEKAATRASWNHWDVIHSAIIVAIIVVFYYCFW